MYTDRRRFLALATRTGLTAATAPLWSNICVQQALAQTPGSFKAILVITLLGGNDGNNVLVPIDSRYPQYASLRSSIAIPQNACIPLAPTASGEHYGLHPSLVNIARLYNNKRALVVANVGATAAPGVKAALMAGAVPIPQQLLAHPAGIAEWESASLEALPATGWGGRIADLITASSGSLPPLLDVAANSFFTAGRQVQAIAVRPGKNVAVPVALPPGVAEAASAIAALDSKSKNNLIGASGKIRAQAAQQTALIEQAQLSGGSFATVFPSTPFGVQMNTAANVLKGRDVIGASRQIIYAQQGQYDTHGDQPKLQSDLLADLDAGIGAFMSAMDEVGLGNQVLILTLSDFGRTMVANSSLGTDHAWGNHQFVIGGGVSGGRVLGQYPDLDLGGSMDFTNTGIWIPSTSVTEMAAGAGEWMGLSTSQLQNVFPLLSNFQGGALSYM